MNEIILSLGSPQLGKCYQGVTAPERLGIAVLGPSTGEHIKVCHTGRIFIRCYAFYIYIYIYIRASLDMEIGN